MYRLTMLFAGMLIQGIVLAAGIGDLNAPGGLGAPGIDNGKMDALLKQAEDAQRQAEEAQRKAEEAAQKAAEDAQQQAGQDPGGKKSNHFVVSGYDWMAESCARIKHPQALLNCESANLDYLQYSGTEDAVQAGQLYLRHQKSAEKAIRLYRKHKR